MKTLLTLFVLFFSSSVLAEVKKVDLQKSLKAGLYNRMSYDCGWSTYSQYSKVTKNFYRFAKKKYRYKSDYNQMIDTFDHGKKREIPQNICKEANENVITSRKRFVERGLRGKFW